MDPIRQKKIAARIPGWTFLILALSLGAAIFPEVCSAFIYDRAAVLRGEVWRLLTGHLVHFGPFHLGYNLVVFCICSFWVERRSMANMGRLLPWMALPISLSLLMRADVIYFGGLSGMACGMLVYLGLCGLNGSRGQRRLSSVVLGVVAVKIALEVSLGTSILFYPAGSASFVNLPGTHVVGSIAAALFFYLSHGGRKSHAPLRPLMPPAWRTD